MPEALDGPAVLPVPTGAVHAADPAREALIVGHIGLAKHLARRFIARGETQDDLIQAAYVALVKAADRFDPSRGVEFSSYATRMIVGELKHHFRDTGWAVRAPRQIQELYLEVRGAVGELTQRLGRSPTVPELAAECRLTTQEVLVAIDAGRGYRTASLDAPPSGDQAPKEVPADGDHTARFEELDELTGHLAKLPERDRVLLELRFVQELSQSEIAARLGVSQMQVSRLLQRSLDTLRRAFREAQRT